MSEKMGQDWRYLLALGSNMRHPRHGSPRQVIGAALAAIAKEGIRVERASRVHDTAPLGPSRRCYANAAAIVATSLDPADLLEALQRIEVLFGRQRRGQPWRERVLDLDVILWSDGTWVSANLVVPHVLFRERKFVLGPASEIAGDWRDPLSHLTLTQLNARLTRPGRAPT